MLSKLYYKIWHDILKRKESFTATVRKFQLEAPLVVMLIFLGLGLFIGIKARRYWWQLTLGILFGVIIGHCFW